MTDDDLLNSAANNRSDERKSRTPKDFLSSAIHELRTPIIRIKGYTEILSNKDAKELHPEAIENISQAVKRLEDVVNVMGDYLHELMKKP